MIYTDLTKKAMKLCFAAHKDQTDNSGLPYVFHPIHVAEQMDDEYTTAVALLHDVVEDSPYTLDDLRNMGFPPAVTEAVALMTHDPELPYMDYVAKIKANPIARRVKLADLGHNSDVSRLDEITEKDLARAGKYARAIRLLEEGYTQKEFEKMRVLDAEFVQGFIRMADDGWQQGWHERNGGNLSYRLKPEEVESIREELQPGEWKPIGTTVSHLAGEYFLVTGSGKYFRNVTIQPEDTLCILELDEKGENYRLCWGLVNGGRPTSELPSHLMNHEVKLIATGGKHRVIYHAHPANIIALTFVLPLTDEAFTRELWEMISECGMVFPEGVGVVHWMVPGGRDIAVATSELMKKYNVAIWAHHGMFASGEDFDLTFGLMHTVEKAAEILVKVRSMQPQKRQTITPEDLRHLAEALHLTMPERFLYEKHD